MPKPKKTQPAHGHGVIGGEMTLPAFQGEGIGRQELAVKQNETVDIEPFIAECVERGLSEAQVFQAVKDRTLIMISPAPDFDEIPLRDSYNEKNIFRFMRAFGVRFFTVEADWFWRKTVPDHKDGWQATVISTEEPQAEAPALPAVNSGRKLTDIECEMVHRNRFEFGMLPKQIADKMFPDETETDYETKRQRIYEAIKRHEKKLNRKS